MTRVATTRGRRIAAGVLAATLIAGVVALACSDAVSHIYTGRTYEPTRDCIGPTQSIDVVKGSDAVFSCDAACLLNAGEGGAGYFVSSECAPYPSFYSVNPADPACTMALAAAARGDVCFEDGGSASPSSTDAGTDAGTGADARTD